VLSYIGDFWKFLVAIVTTFFNLLAGGVIVAAVTLYFGIIKKASPSAKVYKMLALVFGVLACFHVWRASLRLKNSNALSRAEYSVFVTINLSFTCFNSISAPYDTSHTLIFL
jgi:hypothetical protein